jgi:hypothetical protein
VAGMEAGPVLATVLFNLQCSRKKKRKKERNKNQHQKVCDVDKEHCRQDYNKVRLAYMKQKRIISYFYIRMLTISTMVQYCKILENLMFYMFIKDRAFAN